MYGVAIVGILFCPLSGTRKVRISEAPNIQFSIDPSIRSFVLVHCIVFVRFLCYVYFYSVVVHCCSFVVYCSSDVIVVVVIVCVVMLISKWPVTLSLARISPKR